MQKSIDGGSTDVSDTVYFFDGSIETRMGKLPNMKYELHELC